MAARETIPCPRPVEPKKGEAILAEIDRAYEGRHTDTRFVEALQRGKAGR